MNGLSVLTRAGGEAPERCCEGAFAALEALVSRCRRRRAKLVVKRIASGRRTTWQYRRWCQQAGCSCAEGAFRGAAPWPFPLVDPMVCDRCGLLVQRAELARDPEFVVCTLRGRSGHIDEWVPDEFVQVCPQCGARESFQRMIRCAECDTYPCICTSEDFSDVGPTEATWR